MHARSSRNFSRCSLRHAALRALGEALLVPMSTGWDFELLDTNQSRGPTIIREQNWNEREKINDIFHPPLLWLLFSFVFALGITFFPLGRVWFSIKYKAAAILETKSWLNTDFRIFSLTYEELEPRSFLLIYQGKASANYGSGKT